MKKLLKKIKLFILSTLIFLASFVGVQSCAGVNVLSPKVATASAETVTPAQISDLTGTTWEFNEIPDLLLLGTYSINFNSNELNFVGIRNRLYTYLQYNNGSAWIDAWRDDGTGWTNNTYRTITITGGADVTNASLIAWLEDNALIIGGGGEPPIDDLTGTAVIWDFTIDFTLGDEDAVYYDIYFYSSTDFETITAYNSLLLEIYDGEIAITYIANGSGIEDIVYTTDTGWIDIEYQYIYISGGADATNAELLQIIFNNADVYYDGEMGFWLAASNRAGYVDGYGAGLIDGIETGYDLGYSRGFADGQMIADSIGQSMWDYMFIFIQNLFNALTALLSVELVRGVNLGLVTIGIPMIIWAIGAIIRLVLFFFGGSQ